MESNDLPLYTTLQINSFICRLYACIYFAAIMGLIYYRVVYMPSEGYWPWIVVFVSELGLAYGWILDQSVRWRLVERKVFPERLSQR